MKLILGIGLNDADYTVKPSIDGCRRDCKAYRTWRNMLLRAYDDVCQAKQPTYKGVVVCDEWLSFMAFRRWWLENYVDGWHLDKDLLTDKKIYSPATCIYVPRWLNNFLTDHRRARGEWPIGVRLEKRDGTFYARCHHPFGKRENLGVFTTPEDAYSAWLSRKIEIANELKPAMDAIDKRIHRRVVEIIQRLS